MTAQGPHAYDEYHKELMERAERALARYEGPRLVATPRAPFEISGTKKVRHHASGYSYRQRQARGRAARLRRAPEGARRS